MLTQIFSLFHKKTETMDEFEEFLFVLATILFGLLFVRVLVALIMGRWNLF
ncbi:MULTISPECIES: hypothetical protein [Megasphaera]|uniref:Uncharacterized protein n=1 Tax=Megasphaera vaginalis (ex Srinivasan et al. 2021) TaxID=1111454 RepID=U7UM45_9FIRM|nr:MULTISPECIES: hypothetical protein [Megasphaera]ERT60492.1 hypothetical protein HMPREF1250_0687 [Megasphaera vaginalis (ex Srinivasan et al. 2021)]